MPDTRTILLTPPAPNYVRGASQCDQSRGLNDGVQPLSRCAVERRRSRRLPLNRRFLLLAVILTALSGCASVGSTHALATPWGAGGVHSFKPETPVEPNEKAVNEQVTALLDKAEPDDAVRVATR